ncbi:MAG TPA: PhoU domain-containing protein, partial [Thermoplasmata archaeon]|nr:PhoU domain-containing protein [Thermoplasmata archaeon]
MPALEIRREDKPRGGASLTPRPPELESVRILQRMGPVSLGVSLPRSWVEEHRLRVGSPVHLRIVSDRTLRVRPTESPVTEGARFRIDVESGMLPEHTFRCLLGAYLDGAVEFEVVQRGGVTAETRSVARTFARRTIQPEVLSEETERLLLQDVSDASPVPLPKLLGRMGQLVLALHRDAGASWGKISVGREVPWESRDDEVDRQAWFIERCAVRMLDGRGDGAAAGLPGIGALGCWTVARSLERIADHAVKMAETGSRLAEAPTPQQQIVALQQFHEQALRHLSSVLEALAEDSGGRANELLDTGEALHEVSRTLYERLFTSGGANSSLPPSMAIPLGRILESIDRTVAYAQDIAQVALDRALPPPRPPAAILEPTGVPSTVSHATKKETHKGEGGKR